MAATFPIISKRVEENASKSSPDAKRIQQLLVRTGHHSKSACDGIWNEKSIDGWVAYQKSKGWTPKKHVDAMDPEDRLAWLALDANVIMWIPEGLRSLSAVKSFTEICIGFGIPYGWKDHGGGTKMAWGFDQREWAVIFTRPGGRKTAEFDVDSPEPRALNCCSFANLLLSLWMRGDVHGVPYDSSQNVGGERMQVGERFGLPEVMNRSGEKVFDNLDEIKSVLVRDRIYHLALCRDAKGTFTKHDTILINGEVYQANVPSASPNAGAVYVQSLDRQWKKMSVKRARLFGPGPF